MILWVCAEVKKTMQYNERHRKKDPFGKYSKEENQPPKAGDTSQSLKY